MPDLVPVSLDRHGAQVWQRFRSYAFVQDYPMVPVVLGEQDQVAATLPLVVAPTGAGLWPVALTRLGPRTAMVAPNGVWRGAYVPSILRVHPFQARLTTTPDQAALLVDEDSGLIARAPQSGSGWEPFFTPDGQLSPVLAEVVAFFRNRVAAEHLTRIAVTALQGAGVLTAMAPMAALTLPEGVLHVDPDKLAALGRSELGHLHRAGALGLAYAMLVARHHFRFLAQVEAQLDQITAAAQAKPAARQALPEDIALAGFFDAIAASQTRD